MKQSVTRSALALLAGLTIAAGASAQTPPASAKRALPQPNPERLRALTLLEAEVKQYERDAEQFEQSLSAIVAHHYQLRHKLVLQGLDQQIAKSQAKLARARDQAIVRLQEFLKAYSGPNADAQATPDALFRLAALYEERVRSAADADLTRGLEPAIALYRRIISEFPRYQQLAGAHYYLGHALSDAGRIDEGQQVWRSLVCHNRFSVQPDSKSPGHISLQPLLQDHEQRFWDNWSSQHPLPLDQVQRNRWAHPRAVLGDEELRFRDPYQDCEALPQQSVRGEDPPYLAEVWWQLGNYHFDQLDAFAGPYALNRALSSYQRSTQFKEPPLYGVALYKRAWTYYRMQRYRDAVAAFVDLLDYADAQQEQTGDEGTDFRSEAYVYIAGCLTYEDFAGPPVDHPYIERVDVLDLEPDPVRAEDRMRIALERVQDARVIPQDRKWTSEVYRALAQEFIELGQNRNAILALDVALQRFPLSREAPQMQDRVAELYEQLAKLAPERSAVKQEYAARALDARTALASYVGKTPWTEANRDDPEALLAGERLVRRSMQRVAAERTNTARALYAAGKQAEDPAEQQRAYARAAEQYRLAAASWAAHVTQDPGAEDGYESRFWLADARYWNVLLQIELGAMPSENDLQQARQAASDVRDSNEDDKYRQSAAQYLVALADRVLEARYAEYLSSGGARGLQKLSEVQFESTTSGRRVLNVPLPAEVQQAIVARDDYNARIPVGSDTGGNGLLYAFQAADFNFVYGHFDAARERLQPIVQANCGKNVWGYRAWEKLLAMSNFESDAKQSLQLVEGKGCAFDEETRAAQAALRKPVRQGVAYLEARQAYEQAEQAEDPQQRDSSWRKAAALYKAALAAAPERDEAPEAAMNGAYAYKQVGEYDKAIAMYELFITRYGSPGKLDTLQRGDPKAKPAQKPDPVRYEERVKFLKLAYDALANAYVLFFDYPKAATTLSSISRNQYFSEDDRRQAALQALQLQTSLGNREKVRQSRDALFALGASAQQRAQADFVIAKGALAQWDQGSPDNGANRSARTRAQSELRSFYDAYARDDAALEYTVEATYWLAKLARAAGERSEQQWWQYTELGFERLRALAPRDAQGGSTALGSKAAGFAAEGAFLRLDEALREKFDYEAGNLRLSGTPSDVIAAFQQNAATAKAWYDALQRVIDDYASPEWATAALARQGSVYDSLRSSLYNLRPPELRMFDAKTEALLQRALDSDNLQLQEKADAVRTSVETTWRQRRDSELEATDRIVIDRYARTIVWARRYNVSNPAVMKAIGRLAFYSELLGEERLQQYAAGVGELGYSSGLFARIRPGLPLAPPPSARTEPAMTVGEAAP